MKPVVWTTATKEIKNALYSDPKRANQWFTAAQNPTAIYKSGRQKMVINAVFKWLESFIIDQSNHSLGVLSKFWLQYEWKSYQLPCEEIVVSKC